MRFRVFTIGLLLLATASIGAQSPTADTIARDLQRKYDRVTDFSADFVHSYRGGVLKQQATERGTLLVKKPGKMRWEYTTPEKKLFVSDGHRSSTAGTLRLVVCRGPISTTPEMGE